MNHNDDFDNVEEVDDSPYEIRSRPLQRREPEEWKNKFFLKEDKTMIDRKVEIGEIQLKTDG